MKQKLPDDTVATVLPSPSSKNHMTDTFNGNSRNSGSEFQIQQTSSTLKTLPRAILEMASAENCDVEESISKSPTEISPCPSKGDIQHKCSLSNNEIEVNNLADSMEGKIYGKNDKTLYAHSITHESWFGRGFTEGPRH